MVRKPRRASIARTPARFVVQAFLAAIAVGTLLLALPVSSSDRTWTGFIDAAFTATSAVCVTGLTVVDTSTHWSGFGQFVIIALVELGGLGFMTIASLIVLVVSRHLGLRQAMVANTERNSLRFGDLRQMLVRLAVITLTVQVGLAIWLTIRFATSYGEGWGRSAWWGVFHSISAFNNAGFSLLGNSLAPVRTDWLVMVPLMASIVLGGLGFPVLSDIHTRFVASWRHSKRSIRQRWLSLTLHSKVTLTTSAVLLVAGFILIGALEWTNADTFGPMGVEEKALNAGLASVSPRTAGFATVEVADMHPASLLITSALMFIGAGSAGTSGGIKVGTFAILAMVIWSQLRGDPDTRAFRRTIPSNSQRQAITVALLSLGFVVVGAVALLVTAQQELGDALFETISAFGTVGMSMGVTPQLTAAEDLVLMALMLVGRIGPITLGAALVLRQRPTTTKAPEEAPLIG